jgi:hypothetical protein
MDKKMKNMHKMSNGHMMKDSEMKKKMSDKKKKKFVPFWLKKKTGKK